ncbi:MAG: ATP-binding cassette domain-containing protein [Candidatus Eremiobacteraeota bacterium]|nr:ATP-binding cassette domain-containing protein [Candidatus Eremiobacteraeota bacterium]
MRDVSFSVAAGTAFALLGPNGAGKTTTMRMILGIYLPDRGSITWNGKPIDLRVRRRFGYLPEERGLYGKMKVRDQIVYFGRLHGLSESDARTRTARWLRELAIEEYAGRACSELSKGNQQKVQLASAALHEPELLVLDEPFSGLDPVNAEIVLGTIRSLAAQGTTLVLSSHQMFALELACRDFCIIGAGAVRARGTLPQLRSAFPTRTVRVAPATPQLRAVFAGYGAGEPEIDDDGALLYTLPATTAFADVLRDAVAAAPLETFERREPSLEAIYRQALDPEPAAA